MLKDSLRVLVGRFADQDGLEPRKQRHFQKFVIPSARIGARDFVFLASKHKVSHGYSPADLPILAKSGRE
jgi:hypothetical protein